MNRIQITSGEAIDYYKKVEPEKAKEIHTAKDLFRIFCGGRCNTAIPEHLLLEKHKKRFSKYLKSEGYLCFNCWKEVLPPVFEIGEF